jgi:hypothetical protein
VTDIAAHPASKKAQLAQLDHIQYSSAKQNLFGEKKTQITLKWLQIETLEYNCVIVL